MEEFNKNWEQIVSEQEERHKQSLEDLHQKQQQARVEKKSSLESKAQAFKASPNLLNLKRIVEMNAKQEK